MDFVLSILAPAMLSLMMAGLGFALSPNDFKQAFTRRRAIGIGLIVHTLGLPLIAVGLIIVLAPPTAVGFGILILACCSGGTTANVFTHLSGGDTALSIALSLAGKVLTIVTIPLFVGLGASYLLAQEAKVVVSIVDVGKQIFLLMVVPVAIGMAARAMAPNLSRTLVGPVNKASMALLVLFTVLVIYNAREHLAELAGSAGLISVLLCGLAMAAGYLVARLSGLPVPERKAILFHTAVQNAAFAAVLAVTTFKSEEMAVPAIVYTVVMNAGGLLLVQIIKRRESRHTERPTQVTAKQPLVKGLSSDSRRL